MLGGALPITAMLPPTPTWRGLKVKARYSTKPERESMSHGSRFDGSSLKQESDVGDGVSEFLSSACKLKLRLRGKVTSWQTSRESSLLVCADLNTRTLSPV